MKIELEEEKKLEKKVYSKEELALLDKTRIPQHIALIMDGNRRWAKKKQLPPLVGHWRGAEILSRILTAAAELEVKVLTVYAFSTENWNRVSVEVKALMRLLKSYLVRKRAKMVENGVRLQVIGDLSKLPDDVRFVLEKTLEATKEGARIDLVLALSYGSRDEITRAVRKIVADCFASKISEEDICEKLISCYLDTGQWEDPDLLIRTSGESRLSNFLLWQVSYAEVVVTKTLWPDFSEKELLKAILEYQKRELRLGR